MKKIIMLVILAMTTFSCSLLDNEAYQEMKRDRAERGVECYKRPSGYIYCEDRYGNREF
ncbi:MAG: hypothetical protein ACFNJI_01515 [Leptotrichia hongkongensis]